jgi:hypothetical protein
VVRLEDGTSLRLLFKDLSRRTMLGSARRVKPAFLYEPLREIETYRSILGPNRARSSLDRARLRLSRDARCGMEQLFGDYDRVVGHLVALPVTFLHGEFYASNVLVCEEGEGLRVVHSR